MSSMSQETSSIHKGLAKSRAEWHAPVRLPTGLVRPPLSLTMVRRRPGPLYVSGVFNCPAPGFLACGARIWIATRQCCNHTASNKAVSHLWNG